MKLNLNNLNKSGWQTFRFDQIAQSISERVDPNNTDIELYYGLEHLDSESLHIRRSGTPADVNGQKLKCYPGDIIFGKRRAYQRKAAIVTDVAICSAHAMVLRANPEVIDPKLFPFFLHSDQFMHRAVDISVGSLSPTINWKTLREQEFLLPPKEQQAEIAQLLWAADDVVETGIRIMETFPESTASIFREVISGSEKSISLGDVGKVVTGATPSTKKQEYWEGGGVPFVTPADFTEDPFIKDVGREITNAGLQAVRALPENAVLVVSIGATIGKVAIANEACATNQQINAVIVGEEHSPVYVMLALRFFNHRILARAGATTLPIINKGEFSKVRIPLVSSSKVKALESKFSALEHSRQASMAKVFKSKALQKSLINQVF